ncbi:hypothetical protein WK90_08505 [Burkholderia cepacia]|uniref:hypothetical protein n=1 Tax=Burkholderia cepacia TaxID=292 RepID=UPI0007593394|nr:hypothetical protein [Burkholderia cepacia]KVA59301.1 hypothetical protein WI49_28575 [Burkholderia cepacia]KVA63510.1 hypothetical protein WI48_08710 [Burkholderia cepacia]KVA81263.1 hypothetical protein WI51_25815 [Burkholderia cepacia]KVA81310.1 hypothetical protein WI52_21200 [Burkholderia cepacia]KVA94294.1 hypothetical protein WI50_38460 [Burkholderia cepacia]
MMLRHPSSLGQGTDSEPGTDPPPSGIPATLPDSGAVINVRGVAYVIPLPPRDHARPALWRELADRRDERSADGNGEPDTQQD